MPFDHFWDELDFGFGPFRFSMGPFSRNVRYKRSEESHLLHIRIDPSIGKEDIKVRLVEPGVLEVKWPRRRLDEEIEVD